MLEGANRSNPCPDRPAHDVEEPVGRDQILDHPEHRFVDRHVDGLPAVATASLDQRDRGAEGRIEAGKKIADADAGSHGRLTGHAGQGPQLAHRLSNGAEGRLFRHRPALAESGNRDMDQLFIDGLQRLVVETPGRQCSGLEVLDEEIRVPQQSVEQSGSLGVRDIERDQALVAVQDGR